MLRKTTAAIPARPANQPGVTLPIPEGEEIDVVEADEKAPASQKRAYWKKYEHGMLGLYVSEEDIDRRTIPA